MRPSVNPVEKLLITVREGSLLLVAALILAPLLSQAAEDPICEGSAAIITTSPNTHWIASVQERVCSTDKGVAASVQVTIASKASPNEANLVIATAVPRSRDEWPKAVWRSETSLEVWVPNFANVIEVKPSFRDVSVALKYCADDPQARARVTQYQVDLKHWMEDTTRWAKLRKADPEAVGQRPTRPTEPAINNRPCQTSDIP